MLYIAGQKSKKKYLKIAGVEQFYQVRRTIRGIGDALSSTYSQTLNMNTFVRTREMVMNYAREGRSQGKL